MPDDQKGEKIVKVRMLENGYDPAHGKFRKDGVYEFGVDQASRYVRARVAKPAPASAKLARDEDRERDLVAARERQSVEGLDQEMSAMWDIDVRDLERAELEADAAADAAEAAEEKVERAKGVRRMPAPASTGPGEVTSQGPR